MSSASFAMMSASATGRNDVIHGYARVSTTDQDLGIQLETLRHAGAEVIHKEKRSGTTKEGRAALVGLLASLKRGDVLMVTRIDRLARSIGDLQDIVRTLKAKGVALRATEQPIDMTTAAGKCFLDMLGVFAEFETNLRRERQAEGIARARASGVYRGRAPTIDPATVRQLRNTGMPPAAIARELGVARGSVYRLLVATNPAANEARSTT